MEGGGVYGVHRAAAVAEGEDCWGSVSPTVAARGCCRQTLRGEGASQQQAPLRAHEEGVPVPGRHSQSGDAHRAAAPSLHTHTHTHRLEVEEVLQELVWIWDNLEARRKLMWLQRERSVQHQHMLGCIQSP